MPQLSTRLYSRQGAQALDCLANTRFDLPPEILMGRAAQAALSCLRRKWPEAQTLTICCGPGRNGGDGYLLGQLARAQAYQVHILPLGAPQTDFREAFSKSDLVVDACVGTGLNRPVEGMLAEAIAQINQYAGPIFSIDLPSGLCADTGMPQGIAVHATATLALLSLKPGLFTGEGKAYAGEVFFDDLQVPADLYAAVAPCALRYDWESLRPLSPRARTLHKGSCGHVLIVGGDCGMSGAVVLAGVAALRAGAGRVSIMTHPDHAAILNSHCPELMCHALSSVQDLENWRERADIILLGPGLGQRAWGQEIFAQLKDWDRPMVCDADAFSALAAAPFLATKRILTPHPKEAALLLGASTSQIQADRLRAAQQLQKRYGGAVVLKGAGTLVQTQDTLPQLCTGGNPGMATAGMGDVLAGIIAGLWAQGWSMENAATEGVALHAQAADIAACQGERGLMASDVIAQIRGCLQARELQGPQR